MKGKITFKGGKGSGNFGHSGRPGKVGGSGGGTGSGVGSVDGPDFELREFMYVKAIVPKYGEKVAQIRGIDGDNVKVQFRYGGGLKTVTIPKSDVKSKHIVEKPVPFPRSPLSAAGQRKLDAFEESRKLHMD